MSNRIFFGLSLIVLQNWSSCIFGPTLQFVQMLPLLSARQKFTTNWRVGKENGRGFFLKNQKSKLLRKEPSTFFEKSTI